MFYGEPDPVYLPMKVAHESDVPKETSQILPTGKLIPSAIYVDGGARPKTVERDVNPLYWRLIVSSATG